MFIIRYKNIFIGISAILMIASVAVVAFYGIRFGIDFTGGSLIEVEYAGESAPRPEVSEIKAALAEALPEGEGVLVQPTGERGYIIRMKTLGEDSHTKALSALSFQGAWDVTEKRFDSIGASIGVELQRKAWFALAAVMIAIVLFIAYAFRKVSEPVPSWQYGLITLLSLVHDVAIPAAALALLGHFASAEADALFIAALLTVLGFSVHDTIVVFDRVRENLRLKLYTTFAETVGKSLEQTFVRSVNTSLTVVLALAALLLFGPPSIFLFSLILLIGIAAGTYSSIFLASPLLLIAEKMRKGK